MVLLPFLILATLQGADPLPAPIFSKERFEFKVGFSESSAEFDLPLANHGATPVKLDSVSTSCTCMKVTLPQMELPPGGAGRVHCIFSVPNATGPVEKPVILNINSPGRTREVTMVRVEVPSQVQIHPERLTWNTGGPSEEKVLEVSIDGDELTNLEEIRCSRDIFTWKIQTVQEGRRYEIRVKPADTSRPVVAMFLIRTDSKIPRQQKRSFYAAIEPAK